MHFSGGSSQPIKERKKQEPNGMRGCLRAGGAVIVIGSMRAVATAVGGAMSTVLIDEYKERKERP